MILCILILYALQIHAASYPSNYGERIISKKLLASLNMHHLYAAAAMCTTGLPDLEWTCGERCGGETNGTILYDYFHQGVTDTVGHLKTIIVAFRGTSSFPNIIDDILVAPSKVNIGRNLPFAKWGSHNAPPATARVHTGFLKSYLSVGHTVRTRLKSLLKILDNDGYELHFVGHSLGGAIASIASADVFMMLPTFGDRIKLFTYGQPRVGNKDWALWMSSLPFAKNIYRVTRFRDTVPRVPSNNFGFYHFRTEYHIDPFRHVWTCPTFQNETESEFCANVGSIPWPSSAHVDYFRPVTFEYVFGMISCYRAKC